MKNGIRGFCVLLVAVFLLAGCEWPDDDARTSVQAESVRILSGNLELAVDETRKLEIEVLPQGASGYELVWTVGSENRISVERDGTARGLQPGPATATITLYVEGDYIDSDQIELTVLPKEPSASPIDPLELFGALRGRRVRTGGWADNANGGEGIAYANPEQPIIICDERFPDPIAKFEAFRDALDLRNQPVFIIISGDIDLSRGRITDAPGPVPGVTDVDPAGSQSPFVRRFDIRSPDTTIIGINDARIMFGGLRINGNMLSSTMNMIIRNVTFWDARDTRPDPGLDHLLLTGNPGSNAHGNDWPTGVWIDHVRFTSGANPHMEGGDWHDTLLNVTRGETTVSWSEFTNGREVLLAGGNDNQLLQNERRITLHHNYFHTARDRMPRTRGTQMHIYNNYFTRVGNYVMGPGRNAHFVVQNNLFDAPIHNNRVVNWGFNNSGAIVWHFGNAGLPLNSAFLTGGGSPAPILTTDTVLKPWEPGDFYEYTLATDVEGLRVLIPARAGPTLGTIEGFMAGLAH